MNLDLRHLRVVCAIAETGSVTKAAAALGLAQPALTAQLQRIERTLGGPLFERDRRGSRPTALGELVLARARVLLPAMQGLQDEAARLAGGAPARHRIGAVNGPILGGLVHRLANADPDTQVTTYASWSADELAELVLAGRLDYALVGRCGDAAPPAGLAWRVVAVDAVFVLFPDRHPLARRALESSRRRATPRVDTATPSEVDLAELAEAQWAVTPGDGCFADCFAAACARAGFTPRTMYETDVGGCVDLVLAGDAIALCQGTFRRMPGLVAVPLAGAPLRWRHLLGWHPDSTAAALAETVCGYATAAYRDAVQRSADYPQWLEEHPRFGVPHLV